MRENMTPGLAVTRWAVEHWQEWEIVCGLRPASAERNREIFEMLQTADFQELTQMMTARIYAMMLEELARTGRGEFEEAP